MFNGPVFLNETIQANARAVNAGGISESLDEANALYSRLSGASFKLVPSSFKGGTLYSGAPGVNGDLTWTRGSDAFRTNASGVLQRVPWNLLQQSNGFDSAVWVKNASSVASTSVSSPLGPNAYLYSISNVSTNFINQPASIPNTINTFSVFVKKNSGSLVRLNLGSVNSTFNFDTQSISNPSIMSFQSFSNGWFLLSLTANPITNTSTFINVPSTGSVSDSFYIATAQLVEGTTAQTYLPTTDRLNFPRLSYMYGSCPAVLLEPQRTNLMLQSDAFNNSPWSQSNTTVTSNSIIAPDGTLTADTLTDNSTLSVHTVDQTVTNTGTLTYSVYAKKGTSNYVGLYSLSSTQGVYFDINTGVFTSIIGNAPTSYSITNVGNGWYRCTITTTVSGVQGFRILMSDNGTTFSYSGTGKTIYIWGAQLEAGAYPTTYIPTTTATATRVADSFSRSNIYTNGLITSAGGTWFVELRGNVAYVRDTAVEGLFLGSDSLGTTNSFLISAVGGGGRLRINKYVSSVFTQLYLTTTDTTKIAIKWNGSTADVFVNGTKQVSATAFTATQLQFLAHSTNGDVPKFIQQMALFPTPLSDTDCTTLTTL